MSIAHILCVDDDISGLTQLGQQLRQAGYTVTAAASGQAALDLLDAQRFDLVMLDLGMPEMSGLEVLYRVRKSIRPEELPIIMMAAAPEAALIARARDAGVTEFLRKPFSAHHIQLRLDAIRNAPRDFIEARGFAGPDRRPPRERCHRAGGAAGRRQDHARAPRASRRAVGQGQKNPGARAAAARRPRGRGAHGRDAS